MKFSVADTTYPVLSVAGLTAQGFKVEFGPSARLTGVSSRGDDVSEAATTICNKSIKVHFEAVGSERGDVDNSGRTLERAPDGC